MIRTIPDGTTVSVNRGSMTQANGSALPTGIDLVIGNLTDNTSETTLISSDGSTVTDNQTGSPLGQYTNTSGTTKQIGIFVDNGNWNTGTGSSQTVQAGFTGEVR